jgi:hypothetical protein
MRLYTTGLHQKGCEYTDVESLHTCDVGTALVLSVWQELGEGLSSHAV